MTEINDIPDMPALRARIDDVDRQLMALFAHRHALIDRAAQIKRGNGLPARIDDRVEEVAMNAGATRKPRDWTRISTRPCGGS